MTDIQKRTMIKMAALTAIAAAALVGCGKKEEAKPAAAPAAAPVVAKAAPLKIAFAYVGPTGDGGWTFAHDQARKALEKEFGDKIVTSFVEKVPESADAERVFRDLAGQGNKLIFGFTDCAPKVKLLMLRITSGIATEPTTPKVFDLVIFPAITPAMYAPS